MPTATNDTAETFFEKTSQLSNDAFTPFFYNGLEFKTMTHFLEYQKAMKFNRFRFAAPILNATSPEQCLKVNNDITYADMNHWFSEVEDVAAKGLRSKFRQNPALLTTLLKTNESKLIYSSRDDGFWGTGLNRQEASLVADHLWPGQNKLGHLLMKLRESFSNESQPANRRNIYN